MNPKNDTSQQKEINLWRILLIDDDEDDYILTRQMLSEAREGKFHLIWCASYQAGENQLAEDQSFDAVIIDYDLGCQTGIQLIHQAVSQQYPAPILLLTGRGTYEVDVEAMEAGAADYLCKGEMNSAFLDRAIRYAIERKKHELSLRASEAHLRASEAYLRQSEAQLRKSEERYRTLFSSMLNGFALCEMIYDPDGQPVDFRYLEVNPAFERLTGLKAQDVIGKTVREAIPGIEPYWIETYGKVALTGEPAQFENYVSAINKYYQVLAFRPQDNQFAALFIDITQRKQMETDLIASQTDLANAQAVSHTGSWRLDVKRNELLWSVETYRLFGVPIGTPLTYESFLGFIHPDDRTQVDRSWTAALDGVPYDIEHRVCVGEQVKWVRERAVLEFDKQGVLRSGFGTVQDITERKQAEQALRQAEERFRIALSNTSIAVFSTDLELRYTWFYSTAMGRMPETYIGKRDDEILPPEHVADLMALKRRALKERVNLNEEISLGVIGKTRNLLISVEPYYNEGGELLGVIGACVDITDQRRLEQESVQNHSEMEVHHRLLALRERERQEIARDLHDGPVQDLSSVIFSLQCLRDTVQEPATQFELDSARSNIKSVVHDLRNMMNELRPPALIRFGLGKAIQNHIDDLLERYPKMEICLKLDQPEDHLPENISLTLFRVYQEAINNAIRHARAANIWVRLSIQVDQAQLEIRDNGDGFVIPKDSSLQPVRGHYGLPGMKERTEMIGGQFFINSIPGSGTTVQAVIPLKIQLG